MTQSVNLPANVNPLAPLTADVGGTGVANPIDNTITVLGGAVVLNAGGAIPSFGAPIAAGVSPGSAGDPLKCNAPFVFPYTIGLTTYFIPAFIQNT